MQTAEKVVVVMPAYNAGRTLRLTYEELPKDTVSLVILVDDGSTDGTLEVARQLGLEIFVHNRNYGYGANQKTCYAEALRAGADIVVMVHPDYQYDPRLVPQIIDPIVRGGADAVLPGSLVRELLGLHRLRPAHPLAPGPLQPSPSRHVARARLRQPPWAIHAAGAFGAGAGARDGRPAPVRSRARTLSAPLTPIPRVGSAARGE